MSGASVPVPALAASYGEGMKPEEVERSFARGQRILERGATTRELYIVRSGGVRIEGAASGQIRHLVGGDLFGETSAILGRPSPYEAIADDDTVVLVLDLPLINRLCRESPEFSMRLIRHLATEWADALDRAPRLGEIPRDLLRIAEAVMRRCTDGDGSSSVSGALRDLADEAGLGMLDAYRALHQLLDRGWLQLAEDQLSIVAVDALQGLID